MKFGADPAEFIHENTYGPTVYTDPGLRILCLYRYWNNIQYYSCHYSYVLGRNTY